MATLAIAAALSILIGTVLGLLGGGGAILTLPMLVYAVGVEPKAAIATSLFVVGMTGVAGTAVHARRGTVRWKVGASFGTAAMAGAYGGAQLAHLIDGTVLLVMFAVVMLVAAAAMLRERKPSGGAEEVHPLRLGRALALGGGVGILSGLVGAGGGFLIVPALTLFGGLAMGEAIGTSLFVIALQSFAGFAGHIAHVDLDWTLVLVISAASLAGSIAGARLSSKMSAKGLRRAFAWLVIAMAVFILVQQRAQLFAAVAATPTLVEDMNDFTPVSALIGGALIGLAASLLLFTHGKVAGISGLYGGVFRARIADRTFRLAFVLGLVAAGAVLKLLFPGAFATTWSATLPVALVAGVIVGFGTQLGNGCTSGHGVCGLSRMSVRSLVATGTFMATGFATTYVVRHLLGGGH